MSDHPGGETADGPKWTSAGTPDPTAKAKEAHEPEPKPAKQAELLQ
jgi:hypothetical protein